VIDECFELIHTLKFVKKYQFKSGLYIFNDFGTGVVIVYFFY